MAFTDEQRQALKAKLSYRHIKTRSSNGTSLPYVEGWHVIAEANRIFGYDCWDRRTVDPRCVWSELQRGQMVCFYTTKVRITVRAGGSTIVREGIGTGIGRSTTVEVAHDIALKSAETDATKRALATFGNPFGLALYDKDKLQVTKSRRASVARTPRASHQSNVPGDAKLQVVLTLNRGEGVSDRFESPTAYVDAILGLIPTLPTLESLYQFWESNTEGLRMLRTLTAESGSDPVEGIVGELKRRARVLGRPDQKPLSDARTIPQITSDQGLAIPKEKRIRSKSHLAFVASQPCLVCGRRPAQAHHLRFAQPRAMAMKVSDEFTVPLCSGDHDSLHRTGDERAWWARHGIIEPLKYAERLWAASRRAEPMESDDVEMGNPDEHDRNQDART